MWMLRDRGFFCFVMMQKVLPLLCEIMTATEFLVETLLWIQQLTQKVVCSSATLLPIPHPVEIYFEFCVTRYRQARKLAFVLVLIYLDFICLFLVWLGFFFGCVFGFAWDFLFLFLRRGKAFWLLSSVFVLCIPAISAVIVAVTLKSFTEKMLF